MTTQRRVTRPSFWPTLRRSPIFTILLGTVMIGLALLTVSRGALALRELINFGEPETQQITVEGIGSVMIAPDTAHISLGVEKKADTVAGAQEENTNVANTLIEKIKDLGVDKDDIRTSNYNVYENRVWDPDTSNYESKGWVVYQSLNIRLVDLENVSQVINIAGQSGVTNISGITFETENVLDLQQDARDEAIENAEKQAKAIAKALGVKVKGVVNYMEWGGGKYVDYARSFATEDSMGMGGAPLPSIEPGTEEMEMTVSITYQLSN